MWAVVPVKRLADAKQRLAGVLANDERRRLAGCMVRDVLGALTSSRFITGITVVSGDDAVRSTAAAFGVEYLQETTAELNAAVTQGAAHAVSHGANAMLLVPTDVPQVTGDDIDQLLRQRPRGRALTIVADRADEGTNAMVLTPPDLIDFRFGPGSFQAHRAAATAAGARVRVADVPAFGLDIDTPADLLRFARLGAGTATRSLIDELNLVERIAARHNPGPVASS